MGPLPWHVVLLPLLLAGCAMPGPEAATTAPNSAPLAGAPPKLSLGGFMGSSYINTR
jgi:hypothetical protein